jgi:hypothetical protein
MRTILIAQRDADFAEELATELRAWGYRVIDCPGPLPPVARCIRCDKGYCPLTEGADLMIYDPSLTSLDADGESRNLALDSALAHPETPMLLAWSPRSMPDARTLRSMHSAPTAHFAAHTSAALRIQIDQLVTATTGAQPSGVK